MPLARSDARSDSFALHELDRHQRRREQGIPTLTVLAGPPGGAMSLWRRWLDSRRQAFRTSLAANEAEVVREWLEALASSRNLEADAADFLGTSAGLPPGELRSRLEGKTAHERDILLHELFPSIPGGDLSAACRCLLQPQVTHNSQKPLDAVLEAFAQEPTRALVALHALVPAGTAPALLLWGSGPSWLARAARLAARFCDAIPSFVVALQVDRPAVDAYLRSGESQALALVREGLLELEAPSPEAMKRKLKALGVQAPETLSGPLARLAAEGVPDELLTRYGEAALAREAATREPEAADKARSSAERFLRDLLDSLPDTHGLFENNQRTGFRINNRPVEVDFLSQRLRVAIEVDGYYHFQGEEAYRRDRRKDLALQRHGYLVLRFLANDVVARLEEIRDTILEVISQRRDAMSGSSPHREG
ncbi:endonuclease domain-containing protein [Archangium lipolyticum]|uniref:endonuclease domain-containing protein n=1 Tax=Archangium lipolyticum TaxID=2970465 RepID=UPI00214A3E9C|nr:endonuclease domain-containing protein [Archangium lipolyticum]